MAKYFDNWTNVMHDKYIRDAKLYVACKKGDLNSIKTLIKHGADLDWGLKGACESGNVKIVELMIDYVTDYMIEYDVDYWDTALEYACESGNPNIIQTMIKYGVNHWDNGLCGACRGGHLNIVYLMIKYGADYWNWGLKGACEGGHLNIIKLMIELGADRWDYIFNSDFDLIDSYMVDLITKEQIVPKYYLRYPKDKTKILKLCKLGLSVDNFKDIVGFSDFIKEIEERKNIAKYILSGYLIDDLIRVISEFVIN